MFKNRNTLILGGLLIAVAVALAGFERVRRATGAPPLAPIARPHGLLQAQGQLRGKPGQAGRSVQAVSLRSSRYRLLRDGHTRR